jgi:hypothetical protein
VKTWFLACGRSRDVAFVECAACVGCEAASVLALEIAIVVLAWKFGSGAMENICTMLSDRPWYLKRLKDLRRSSRKSKASRCNRLAALRAPPSWQDRFCAPIVLSPQISSSRSSEMMCREREQMDQIGLVSSIS